MRYFEELRDKFAPVLIVRPACLVEKMTLQAHKSDLKNMHKASIVAVKRAVFAMIYTAITDMV